MLRKIVMATVLIPLVVILVGFAVVNRQAVTVSFDPFDQAQPAYTLTLPLFGMVFLLVILGVLIGGIAAWLRQGRWRRTARRLDVEVRALRGEVEALHVQGAREPSPEHPAPPLMLPPMS
jgi:uncharacterized integral membrane protein